jgi:hypothetical protein
MLGVISLDNITLMVHCVIFTLVFGFLTPNGNSSLVGKAELGGGEYFQNAIKSDTKQ